MRASTFDLRNVKAPSTFRPSLGAGKEGCPRSKIFDPSQLLPQVEVEGPSTLTFVAANVEGRNSRRAFFDSNHAFFAPNLRFIPTFAPKSKLETPLTLTFVSAKVPAQAPST